MRNRNKDNLNKRWLEKKEKKHKHWQIKMFLNNLRIPFKIRDEGQRNYCIEAIYFGMRFRFSGFEEMEDGGWKVFQINEVKLEKEPEYFWDEVMWYLVEKGYFYFLMGNRYDKIAKHILIDAGWAKKIISKRLELCGKSAENTFMRSQLEVIKDFDVNLIISHYTLGFFGYLF